jgi:ferritin
MRLFSGASSAIGRENMSETQNGSLISPELNTAFNEHVSAELAASHLYLNVAAYFGGRALKLLSKMFFKQAEEEHAHALKFIRYIADTGGKVSVPAVEAQPAVFESVEHVFQLALEWEWDVTRRINKLMIQAVDEKDFAAQDFLKWFVTEQVEEVKTMDDMLKVAQASGERNIMMVEAYLVHQD